MKHTARSDKEKLKEFEAQIAALKVALKKEHESAVALEKARALAEKEKHAADKQLSNAEQELRRLRAFAASLTENLDIAKLMLWAKQSEKLTNADLKKLREDLARTVMNPDTAVDNDIAEASRPEDTQPQQGKEAPPVPPIEKAKERGRQPGVRTCGRDMSCFDILQKREVIHDLKKELPDDAYAQSLVFVREDRRQQLEYVRSHYRNKVTVTYIYRDENNTLVSLKNLIAPDFVKGGKLTNGAVAAIITDKVIWSLPLYRQAKRINMIGGGNLVNTQLLSSYFLSAGCVSTYFWEAVLKHITSQDSFHGDESRLLVVNDPDKGTKNLGQMWALSYEGKQAPAAYFKFYPSREGKWAKELYQDCKGAALQTDAYPVYASLVKDMNAAYAETIRKEEGDEAAKEFLHDVDRLLQDGILLVGCAAHARRGIHKCFEGIYKKLPESEGYSTCNTILGLISQLYAFEKELRPKYRSGELDEKTFLQTRKAQAVPVVKKLKAYAQQRLKVHAQENNLRKALKYIVNQIDFIANYLECSDLTPDNNFQERQIRGLAITRKNCLFASTNEGALAWSKLLTLLQTAILNKVDPTLYLKYLLDQMAVLIESDTKAKDVDWSQYLPWNIDKKTLENAWDT